MTKKLVLKDNQVGIKLVGDIKERLFTGVKDETRKIFREIPNEIFPSILEDKQDFLIRVPIKRENFPLLNNLVDMYKINYQGEITFSYDAHQKPNSIYEDIPLSHFIKPTSKEILEKGGRHIVKAPILQAYLEYLPVFSNTSMKNAEEVVIKYQIKPNLVVLLNTWGKEEDGKLYDTILSIPTELPSYSYTVNMTITDDIFNSKAVLSCETVTPDLSDDRFSRLTFTPPRIEQNVFFNQNGADLDPRGKGLIRTSDELKQEVYRELLVHFVWSVWGTPLQDLVEQNVLN